MTRPPLNVLLLAAALAPGCAGTGSSSLLWEDTGGPFAQNISAVLPDGRIAGTVYASLAGGDIAVSTSDGRTWGRAGKIPGGPQVHRLAQDPDNPDRLFAATDAGAFLSANRGGSWTPLHAGPAGTGVRVIVIDPWSPSTLYAGTGGKGLYKSTDGGSSWDEINAAADLLLSGSDVYDIGIDLSKPDMVYAALSPYGIVVSTNGGSDWRGLTPGMSGSGTRATRLLLRKDARGSLMYGTTSGSIMRTTNGGESWSPSRTGKEFDGILSLTPLPGRPDGVIAGTERGLIISSDFGARWGPPAGDLPSVPVRAAVAGAGSQPTIFAYGNGMGLRASDDNGASWRPADMKFAGSTVGVLVSNAAGDRVFAGTGGVCMPYTEGPSGGWADAGPGITGGNVRSLSVDPGVSGLLYATTAAGVFLSTDDGASWQAGSRSLEISPFLFEAHPSITTRMFMAGDEGLFVSTDRGRTWIQSRPLGNRWHVHALTFSPSNAGTIIGATSNSGVILSRDGGFTWEQARYGIAGDSVALVALDDADPDIYYAYMPGGECFRSLNKGLEWNRYSPPWKRPSGVLLATDPRAPNSIVALVDNRQVYYSPSGGGTWFRIFSADLRAEATSLCWNSSTKMLYAGARDRGVQKVSLGGRIREILGE